MARGSSSCKKTELRSLSILMEAMLASLQEIFRLSDGQLSEFVVDFESRLPKYLRNALHHENKAA